MTQNQSTPSVKTSNDQPLRHILDLMHTQRESLYARLFELPPALIWKRPGPGEWSVGENLDHMVVIYRSTFPLFIACWWLLRPVAWLRRDQPYQAEIDNVYLRPGFPQKVGWMWPPRFTPARPVSLEQLYDNARRTHHQIDDWYSQRDPALLGSTPLWDLVIGLVNLIQGLRVGVYHDDLHRGQIERTIKVISA